MSIGIDPVAAALSLVGLLRDVVNAYTAVGDQIDTWRDRRATLNALAVKLGAIGSTAMQLQDAGAPVLGLQEATDKLKAALEKALAEVKRLQDLRKSHSRIKQLQQWPNMHKAVQQAKASLDNIAMAAGDFHLVADLALAGAQLTEALHTNERLRAQRVEAAVHDVDAAMVKAFSPPDGFLLFLEQQKKTMGDDYPLLAFTDPEKAAVRDKMLAGMKELMPPWKELGSCIDAGFADARFFEQNQALLHQGRKYRLLVEPLDTCNWYWRRKHEKGFGHYVDGIGATLEQECSQDNHKRPGRYRLLQDMERRVLGSTASSLGVARRLQQQESLRKQVEELAPQR